LNDNVSREDIYEPRWG
jgi:hypothetical protein